MPKTTISVITAEGGSFPGHSRTHPKVLEKASRMVKEQRGTLLIDSFVTHCGGVLGLILTHTHGVENEPVHRLAGDVLGECTRIARGMKLHGAGHDMLSSADTGTLAGSGPGVAEMEFEERESDPVLIFMADTTGPAGWNFFLAKIFADPFITSGLVTDPALHEGFIFEVHDIPKKRRIHFRTPEETYTLLSYIAASSRYVIKSVYRRDGSIAASTGTEHTDLTAGRYSGCEAPAMIVRAENGFPCVAEVIEPFSIPTIGTGRMPGSRHGPFMPVGVCDASSTRSGLPRCICLGFQICKGELIGPADMFDDIGFDRVRARCSELADLMRDQGPFEPPCLSRAGKESSLLPGIEKLLSDRWEAVP